MPKATLLNIRLVKPEATDSTLTPDDSWLLCSTSGYRLDVVTAFGVEGLDTSALGRMFPDIRPQDGNRYEIELGATIPDLFPNLNEKQDYNLEILVDGQLQKLAVSNRMFQVVCVLKDETFFGLFPAGAEATIEERLGIDLKINPPTQLRTTVTSRFWIEGDDAHNAVEHNIEACLKRFTLCLNRLLSELQLLDVDTVHCLSAVYHQTTFPWIYLLIGDGSRITQCRLTPHASKIAFVSSDFPSEKE